MRSHIPNNQELMDPHEGQSSFHIAGLRYSVGNLHFSSLRLVILITTEPFPFSVKVVPSCSAQQDFLALCAVSPSRGYLGCGLLHTPGLNQDCGQSAIWL